MKRFFQGLIYLFCLTFTFSYAIENDPVIMKINGKEVLASDFSYIYDKYHMDGQKEKTSVQDYVPMYVNFRLKIEAALSEGMDTTRTFDKELTGYRTQLAKQYLDPARYAESMLKSIYDQSLVVVEASHIFIKTPTQSLPADTLVGYDRIQQIYQQLQNGEAFEQVALKASDDIGTDESRPGYLGWLYPMIVIEPLTNAAYATPVGTFSKPIRSTFGYHIVKVHAKKPNPGEIMAAHILISTPQNADDLIAKYKIDSIYNLLQNGADFAELAKEYSDDKGSAVKGGELSWFGLRKMVPEFESVAFSLNTPGEYSAPFKSRFGYHIVKLIAKRPYPEYDDDFREDLTRLLVRSDRMWEFRMPQFKELKKAYDFKLNQEAYQELVQIADKYHPKDSTFFSACAGLNKTLFTINDLSYSQTDFINYMKRQFPSLYSFSQDVLTDKFNAYVYGLLMKKEERNLEVRFPDFKNLMNEYHDGMLLFEISNREVWNKAGKDTLGLDTFFQKHVSDYKWPNKKYKGIIVLCKNEEVKKKFKKFSKIISVENIDDIVKKNFDTTSVGEIKIIKGIYAKGENPLVDSICFLKNKNDVSLPDGYSCYYAKGEKISTPETYKDVKGLVISDYQEELEKEWIESLSKRFPVEIYWDVINESIQN